ncbi:hypothetical protein H0G86_001125 [Trichoderma simmonsii]|uniref:Uncharacterized protein n=1 Tax=Trichoderma simmonsii TaxID=1491479 RepID=A0A8G0L0Z4_9HYPO|nr:hypothetical protein H0G86_001125 [Trichoderma simmonsii]
MTDTFEDDGDAGVICLKTLTAEELKFSMAEDHPVLSQELVTAYHRRMECHWAAQEDANLNPVTKLQRAAARVACAARQLNEGLLEGGGIESRI